MANQDVRVGLADGRQVLVTDDGEIVVFSADGESLWALDTSGLTDHVPVTTTVKAVHVPVNDRER